MVDWLMGLKWFVIKLGGNGNRNLCPLPLPLGEGSCAVAMHGTHLLNESALYGLPLPAGEKGRGEGEHVENRLKPGIGSIEGVRQLP